MAAFSSSLWSGAAIAPEHLADIQSRFFEAWRQLHDKAQQGQLDAPSDRRFSDPSWAASPASLWLVHNYLLVSRTLKELVDAADLDDATRERLRFSVMQWTQAASPSNFLLTNAQAQQKALETGGQSLFDGFRLLLEDMQKGRLSQTDETAFEIGVDVARTPGAVIHENPLMQLIQYAPQTATVYARPLVIIPPNINKYYILDLQAHNSFVQHAVEQGFTVFMVSWRNPLPGDTDDIQRATWGDYLQNGVLEALDAARLISGQDQVNALGFCVGGTLLASALALAHARGRRPVAALTLLTSFLDFSETGVLNVFVDEFHAQLRDRMLGEGGLLSARELATTFSFLRPGELVWNYVSSNYLLGVAPPSFDLLYWNADGTNLPGPFFTWYFRNAYLENRLAKAGEVVIDGQALDLSMLDMPAYLYASREDHIVPWESAYASTRVLAGPQRFVLGASGHIAGVINPPARKRRCYWAFDTGRDPTGLDAQQWLQDSREHPGSWWTDWISWLGPLSGDRVAASQRPGDTQFVPIEPAPGRYVRVRAD